MHTTFKLLHYNNACTERYQHLAKKLGGITKYGRDTPITMTQILDANGLNDALWAFCSMTPNEDMQRAARLFACACAERVLPIYEKQFPDDSRVRDCINTARRFAVGEATSEEMAAANAAVCARAASWAAVCAWAAANAAVCARDASRAASRAASWATVCARAAANAAVCARDVCARAAGAAERTEQEKILRKLLKDVE